VVTDRRNFDTLTPEFLIRINQAELPLQAKADLISASVLDDVNATGMFSFTLLCWDGSEMKVKWVDDDLFKEGNSVEIDMGYRDNMKTLFRGELTGLEPQFPYEHPPILTVRGYDRRHRLMGKSKTRTFLKMKDSDIASQIAGDWGLTPEVRNTGVVLDYVLQHNQTDFAFLQERAQRISYELVVTDRTLFFRPRQNEQRAVVTLNREVELLDFYARLSTIGQMEEVLVRGWNPRNKEELVARSVAGDERPMAGSASGPMTAQKAFKGTESTAVNTPVQSQSEADQLASSWLREMALRYVIGRGVCIGRPDLQAGSLVNIEGLGRRFSGPYYVTSTEHTFKPSVGYRTAFTVRRNAT
jgi:phage protein D